MVYVMFGGLMYEGVVCFVEWLVCWIGMDYVFFVDFGSVLVEVVIKFVF